VRPGLPAVLQDGPDVLLSLHVQPRASRNQLVFQGPDRLTLRLTAPPVEGAANAACCAFLAEQLDLPKSRVAILRGETARRKRVRIRGAKAADVLARLQAG
jgi:uncharacterized protein (TIGR00251 family)